MRTSVHQRMLVYGIGAGFVCFFVLALSAAIIPSPIFPREETVRTVDYAILGGVTLLASALGTTYAIPRTCPIQKNTLFSSGILSFLAIGCPVCNVAVVALVGTGGALARFEPVQPLLGFVAIGLLSFALVMKVRELRHSHRTSEDPVA